MSTLLLIQPDPAQEAALAADAELAEAYSREDWARAAEIALRHVGPLLDTPPAHEDILHWSGYFAVEETTRAVVGQCAFKGPPDDAGTVEIAYFTYPAFEGRGYATAMAQRLIGLARKAPEVRQIIAHTLPEPNASTRVLEKAGLRFVGEVMDPEDGRVWRWQIAADAAPQNSIL